MNTFKELTDYKKWLLQTREGLRVVLTTEQAILAGRFVWGLKPLTDSIEVICEVRGVNSFWSLS